MLQHSSECIDAFSIKPSDFDYLKTIGQGSFGRVYMVRRQGEGKVYAMKVLGKEHIKMRNEAGIIDCWRGAAQTLFYRRSYFLGFFIGKN